MENNNLYSHENFGLLFNPVQHEAEFFAEVGTMGYTDFRKIEESDGYWIRENFNCGRYVIVLYQRHSVYAEGKRIFLNSSFRNEVGRYSRYKTPQFMLFLDKPREYFIESWGRSLVTHSIQDERGPLQTKCFTLEAAEAAALKYSEEGYKVLVAEWFEDHDMY